jgi:uncharacterized protein YndB with AHSA1/START domain
METSRITIQSIVLADIKKVWDYYTLPEHITNWNFADPSWHCPSASNDLKIGGQYKARMEARDGSFGFDFEAIYLVINKYENFIYEFGGRQSTVEFKDLSGQTEVTISFEPETENSIELQKNGWQAILDNFKIYTETH